MNDSKAGSNAEFLRELVMGHKGRPWVTGFKNDPLDENKAKWRGHVVRTADDIPNGETNSYFSLALFPPDAAGRRKEHATAVAAVALDDIETDSLEELPLLPSWIIETSPSNCQVGYGLAPGESMEDVERLLRALTKAGHKVGPDKSGNNAVRYCRLPSGINSKRAVVADVGRPFPCRLLDRKEARYTVSVLAEAFNVSLAVPPQGEASEPQGERLDVAEAVRRIATAETLHGETLRLTGRLLSDGMRRDTVIAMAQGIMDLAPDDKRDDRWKARRRDIPRLVYEAIRKGYGPANQQNQQPPSTHLPQTREEWPDPEPLGAEPIPAQDFPVDALPKVMREAVKEYHTYGQQPVPLIASCSMAAMSLACQGHADIARDARLVGPISLFVAVIALSGERKSAADKTFSCLLRDWVKALQKVAEEEIKTATAKRTAWEAKLAGARTALSRLEQGTLPAQDKPGKDEPVTDALVERVRQRLEARVAELVADEPRVPTMPRVMFNDATIEALAEKMQRSLPVGALWEDEGGQVIGSVGMREDRLLGFLASLSKLWDASGFSQDRASVEDREMYGKRLTVNLMLQPAVLDKLAGMEGGLARTQGFLARVLVCEPPSTMGTRLYVAPGGMEAVDAFNARILELMTRDFPLAEDSKYEVDPPVMQLDPEAAVYWREYHDDVEGELKETGELIDISDFASKSAEQAVRIAGNFHLFDGHEPDEAVSKETMENACTVAAWFLDEALRVMGGRAVPQATQDALALWDWAKGMDAFTPSQVINLGPNRLRKDKARREAALLALEAHSRVICRKDGKQRTYHVNPKARDDVDSQEDAA